MGIARTQDEDYERREFKTLVALAAMERRKNNGEFKGLTSHFSIVDLQDKLVCVTGGVSYFGFALVNRLLLHGYIVRVLVDNQGIKNRKKKKTLSDSLFILLLIE